MSATFDVIVLGVGGMGSAVVHELSRRGRRVLGLEQFPLVHERGSSHGQTRVIRQAYYEHPNYVPLLRRAYEMWYDLEQATGRHLFTECGCLNVGPVGGELIDGVRSAAREHHLTVQEYEGSDLARRFPQFRFGSDLVGVLEARAGFLYVEECVRAHCEVAQALGAVIHTEEPVTGWEIVGDGVVVRTARGIYHAARLVVTAGAWATRLLNTIGVPLTVMRQVQLWFRPTMMSAFRRDVFPVFLADVPGGPFYGLPAIDPRGLKAARHYHAPELPDPDAVEWGTGPDDARPLRDFLSRHLPAADGEPTDARVCMYTLTPDRHFVLDLHPRHPQVVLAAGFSGHGFKFASVVGEVLADLAESGQTRHPIEMFRCDRFVA